jgi:hypothetical protein
MCKKSLRSCNLLILNGIKFNSKLIKPMGIGFEGFSEVNIYIVPSKSGPGSSVSIATDYGLDGLGIESQWGQDFLHLFRPFLGPTQPPGEWVPGLSRR